MTGADLLFIFPEDQDKPKPKAAPRVAAVLTAVAAPVVIAKVLGAETAEAALLGIIMAIALAFLIRPQGSRR
jgi:hypothetical protein